MLSFLCLAILLQRPPLEIVISGYRAPAQAQISKHAMFFLPFDVPKGATSIEVTPDLDHGPDKTQRNVADLGLFDPRGYGPGGPGFRGWQGGAGNGFTLTGSLDTTSPWYIPGELPAGRWHLAQYFLKSTPYGLRYKYTVTIRFDGTPPGKGHVPYPSLDDRRLSWESRYYAGNLHTHTIHSDGGRTLVDMVSRAKGLGFEFVASTEHNSPTALYEFPAAEQVGPLLLLGTELTTPGGHAGIIGQKPGYWWDFRTDPGDGGLPKILDEVHRQGALFIINHPFATCTTCGWKFGEDEWKGASGIEVWNNKWSLPNQEALDWWDGLLRRGFHLNAYGGTDYHRGEDAMVPCTWTFSKGLDRKDIQYALRLGHVVLSDDPRNQHLIVRIGNALPGDTVDAKPARVYVEMEPGAQLYMYDERGLNPNVGGILDAKGKTHFLVDLRGRKFIRFELRKGGPRGEMLALTNAFFVKG